MFRDYVPIPLAGEMAVSGGGHVLGNTRGGAFISGNDKLTHSFGYIIDTFFLDKIKIIPFRKVENSPKEKATPVLGQYICPRRSLLVLPIPILGLRTTKGE